MIFMKKLCILMLLIVSTVAGFASTSMVQVWFYMELGLLFFIILLQINPFKSKMVYYFITQSLASLVIVSGCFYIFGKEYGVMSLMTLALMVKLGAPPFHSWFLSVGISLMRDELMVFLTISKFLPLYVFAKHLTVANWFHLLTYGVLVCCLSALQVSNLKKMIILSSLFMTLWVMNFNEYSHWGSMTYFVYSLMLIAVMMMMSFDFNQHSSTSPLELKRQDAFGLFCLSGVPPSPFFINKYYLFTCHCFSLQIWINIAFILATLCFTFLYLNLMIKAMSLSNYWQEHNTIHSKHSPMASLLLLLTTIGGLWSMFFFYT